LELNFRPPLSGPDRRGGYESCAPRTSSGQAKQLSYLAKFLFPFLGKFGIIGYLPKHLFSFLFTQSILGLIQRPQNGMQI
jgi:hypothetical protein